MCVGLILPLIWSSVVTILNCLWCGIVCPKSRINCRNAPIFNRYANLITLLLVITFMYFFPLIHRYTMATVCRLNQQFASTLFIGHMAPKIYECSNHNNNEFDAKITQEVNIDDLPTKDPVGLDVLAQQNGTYFHQEAHFFAIEMTAYFYLLMCLTLYILNNFGCAQPLYEEFYVAKSTFPIIIFLFLFYLFPKHCKITTNVLDSKNLNQKPSVMTLDESLIYKFKSIHNIMSCENLMTLRSLTVYSSIFGFISFNILVFLLLCNRTNHWMTEFFNDKLLKSLSQISNQPKSVICFGHLKSNKSVLANIITILLFIVVYGLADYHIMQRLRHILPNSSSGIVILNQIIIFNDCYLGVFLGSIALIYAFSCFNYSSGDLVSRTYETLIITSHILATGLTCLMLYINFLIKDTSEETQLQFKFSKYYSLFGIFYFFALNILYPASVITTLRYGTDEMKPNLDNGQKNNKSCSSTASPSNVISQDNQINSFDDNNIEYCRHAMFTKHPIQFSYSLVYGAFFLAVLSFGYNEFVSNSFTHIFIFSLPMEILIFSTLVSLMGIIVIFYLIHIVYHIRNADKKQLNLGRSLIQTSSKCNNPKFDNNNNLQNDMSIISRFILSLNRPHDLFSRFFGESIPKLKIFNNTSNMPVFYKIKVDCSNQSDDNQEEAPYSPKINLQDFFTHPNDFASNQSNNNQLQVHILNSEANLRNKNSQVSKNNIIDKKYKSHKKSSEKSNQTNIISKYGNKKRSEVQEKKAAKVREYLEAHESDFTLNTAAIQPFLK